MDETPKEYPASLSIDYPDKPLNKQTTFFRLLTVIPITLVLMLISGFTFEYKVDGEVYQWVAGGGVVFMSLALMILFRQKYPRWWFDWNYALTKFMYRVSVYMGLMTDQYPSTDEEQTVHVRLEYPDVEKDLNRWLPLVKWFLAIPHYIVLAFLCLAAMASIIMAWFAILFTGKYPVGLFDFVAAVLRWSLRVNAYALLLITDEYPPFNIDA